MAENVDNKKPLMPSGPKVMDVMRPGRAHPSASSRPLIPMHKSQAQDTTLTDNPGTIEPQTTTTQQDDSNTGQLLDSHMQVSVEPPTESDAEHDVQVAEPDEEPSVQQEAIAADTTQDELLQTQTTTEIKQLNPLPPAETAVEEPQPSPSAEQPQPSVEPESSPIEKQPEITGEPSAEVEQELTKPTVDTSQMVVSVHNAQRNLKRGIVLLVVALLIIVVGLDLLLDVGGATSGIPHTHLFGK